MIRKIDHYNIRTTKFEDTVRFYVDILGMTAGRPPMASTSSPPSWIYDGSGVPAVHLIPVDPKDPEKSYAERSQFRRGVDITEPPAFHGSGAIDHIAFECEDYDEILGRLKSARRAYAENFVAQINLRQIFVKDPNGVTLELNFRS